MEGERSVGGLVCSEVLERLSDYLDGRVSEADRVKIDLHLKDCDACERFGGTFGKAIGALRQELQSQGEPSAAALERLREGLASKDKPSKGE